MIQTSSDEAIQYMSADELIAQLDDSVDLDGYFTKHDVRTLEELFERKYKECSQAFIAKLLANGIDWPVCVSVDDNYWTHGDGHHRTAVALKHGLPLPVLFDEVGDYMHDGVCSDLSGDHEFDCAA